MRMLFVDPASKSTGWALFVDGKLQNSGTIAAGGSLPIQKRLGIIYREYCLQFAEVEIDEIHIEQLPRSCHHLTHWSVGVIAASFSRFSKVYADVSPRAWQKFVGWTTERKTTKGYQLSKTSPLRKVERFTKSADELSAIGIGLYWLEVNK